MLPTSDTHTGTDRNPLAGGILAAFLEGRPDTARRLLNDHVDDGRSHCAACPDQASWPCAVHDVAAAAAGGDEPPDAA